MAHGPSRRPLPWNDGRVGTGLIGNRMSYMLSLYYRFLL